LLKPALGNILKEGTVTGTQHVAHNLAAFLTSPDHGNGLDIYIHKPFVAYSDDVDLAVLLYGRA
jgi:hypothetical protein